MIKYFLRKKKAEWKVKALFYETLGSLLDNQKELVEKLADIIREEKSTADTAEHTADNNP